MKKKLVRTAFVFLVAMRLSAELPEIRELGNQDLFFRQLQEDIMLFHQAVARNRPSPGLVLYRYRRADDDTIFTLAARFSLPYETLATINRISSSTTSLDGRELFIPNQPGLFVPLDPTSELERLLNATRLTEDGGGQRLSLPKGVFYFFPGARFNTVERSYFLNILFRFPVAAGRLTSSFGNRISPLTGRLHFHEGVDIAAPENTEVYAVRDGSAVMIGFDRVLGNYIVLSHGNGYNTIYGHLATIDVYKGQEVRAGQMIGRVGSTGLSTGPHLHFEVRKEGQSLNPSTFLPALRPRP